MSGHPQAPPYDRSSTSNSIPRSSYGSSTSPHGEATQAQNPPNRMAITGLLNPDPDERYQNSQTGQRGQPTREAGHLFASDNNPSTRRASNQPAPPPPQRRGESSTRSSPKDRNRPFRPPYSEEEVQFVYYHRCDLGLDWPEITRAYNAQFPHRPRDIQGIQCKYYRYREERHLPNVRNAEGISKRWEEQSCSLRTISGQPNLYYPWMR